MEISVQRYKIDFIFIGLVQQEDQCPVPPGGAGGDGGTGSGGLLGLRSSKTHRAIAVFRAAAASAVLAPQTSSMVA